MDELRRRNLRLIEAAGEIFKASTADEWTALKRNLTGKQVRELYEVVAELWPPDTELSAIIPADTERLRALYIGDVLPDRLPRNVFRFSLYSDEILMVDPFHNPWNLRSEYNPLENPDKWKVDTLKLVLFLRTLAPWVAAGIVRLVPDPGNFDHALRRRAWSAGRELMGSAKEAPLDPQYIEDQKDWFFRQLASQPADVIAAQLRRANPGITDDEVAACLEDLQNMQAEDPLALEQTEPEQMHVVRAGAGLPMSLYLCHKFAAFPYVTEKNRWSSLANLDEDLPGKTNVWTPLTHSFHGLEFRFLDNVTSEFALSMRQDGRLEPFRGFLRRIWTAASSTASHGDLEEQARDFKDELAGEYEKAKADWTRIDRDLLLTSGTAVAGGVAAGALSLAFPMLGLGVGLLTQLVGSRMKRREFRRRVPMSVFLDLEK